MAKNICEHGFSTTMNRLVSYRLVIKSLHISSTLTCPSSPSWVYIIFHMKTNIHKYLVLKYLPTTIKTYTVTSSPNCQLLSTLFFPHLLHSLQICSARSHSDVRLMFLHYHQYKPKTHKSVFLEIENNANKNKTLSYPDIQVLSTSTPLAHSPHSLHPLIDIIRQSRENNAHETESLYQFHPQQFLSSSFYIMLHIIRDKYVCYIMVCLKLLCT